MRPFIYSIIFLFTINTIFSQTEELVLRKGFDIDQNTILNLDVDNATIQFVESTDDKIHIAYSVLFEKNSEEVVFKVFKDLYANATKSNNVVNLEVKNSMYLGELHALDVNIETYTKHIGEYIKNIKKNEFLLNFIASNLNTSAANKQSILEVDDLQLKAEKILKQLIKRYLNINMFLIILFDNNCLIHSLL